MQAKKSRANGLIHISLAGSGFNPTTQTFGFYDITTTDGLTDSLTGAHFALYPNNHTGRPSRVFDAAFEFQSANGQNFSPYNLFIFSIPHGSITGTFLLDPDTFFNDGTFQGSGEVVVRGGGNVPLIDVSRVLQTGSLVVTEAAPVPEASTTVSFGLLLALGLGGLIIASEHKKTNCKYASTSV